jgi:uncharacterized membrane protein (UPF0127 family)
MRCVGAAAAACVLASCSGDPTSPAASATRTPPADGQFVRFVDGPTAVVEVADSREEQIRGLMGRRELGADEGMLFVFPRAQRTGFWMKNTLIPLSIAYMDRTRDGLEVVAIKEMTPCRAVPCPTYPPGASYEAALEMNAGWFERHGIEVGARAHEEITADPAGG